MALTVERTFCILSCPSKASSHGKGEMSSFAKETNHCYKTEEAKICIWGIFWEEDKIFVVVVDKTNDRGKKENIPSFCFPFSLLV